MATYYNYNGKLFEVSDPAIPVSDHSYRYGDGLFETMKMINGTTPLINYHVERLFYGMQVLGFRVPALFSKKFIEEEIKELAKKNDCEQYARIRFAVSRGKGGVSDCNDELQYTIECTPIDPSINNLNENGFIIDIFPDAIKSADQFSNLKSSSYLSSIMAARYAKGHQLNDALILNQQGRICEASIANIFRIKNETVFTPPLAEGCVAGVMRKYLLEKMPDIQEKELTIDELQNADEVFLTNAVYGMRWVRQFGTKTYGNLLCSTIFKSIVSPVFK